MPSRRNLVEQFSTFLQFEGDRPRPWLTDPGLRRSMERRLENAAAEASADAAADCQEGNFWALFWHKQWLKHQSASPSNPQPGSPATHAAAHAAARPNPIQQLPQNHLAAFVQDGCYWAAHKTVTRFKNLPYGLSDCFQLAIAQFTKILRGFDAAYGSDFATYANAAFASLIRETLRQRNEVDICTDWGLLRKLSKKRLTEAMQLQGLGDRTVLSYVLAWQGFKLHYVPTQATGTRKLTKPDGDTLAAIASHYNQQKREIAQGHDASPLPDASPADIEAWLIAAAQAARQYLYPGQVSINAQRGDQETEFIDSLPETNALSPMDSLVETETQQERQQQRQALGEVLAQLLAALDDDAQALLGFYYRDGLTQQEMAKALDVKQYTVSRKLSRIRQGMVKQLAQWSVEQISIADVDNLHTCPDLDLLNTVSSVLDEWLQRHFSDSVTELRE